MFKPSSAAEADANATGNQQQYPAAPRTSESVRRNWLAISKSGWQDWPRIAPAWHSLAESSDASFFLSSAWVTTWMERFGRKLRPDILTFYDDFGHPAGFCALVKKTVWRKFIPMRTIFLNCAGEEDADGTCIEYNHLLTRPGAEQSVMRYDQGLSTNTRTQIRRSLMIYGEKYGPLLLSEPSSAGEAISYLHKLAALHQSSWTKRGKPGVFSSAVFRLFHESLVLRAFPLHQVQLLKVTAGAKVVGVLVSSTISSIKGAFISINRDFPMARTIDSNPDWLHTTWLSSIA